MLALGALLTSTALLLLAAAVTTARRPDAPRWTTASWAGELTAIAIVAVFAIGLANFIAGVATAYAEGPQLVDLGLLAVVLCGALVIGRMLRAHAGSRAAPVDSGSRERVARMTIAKVAGSREPPRSRSTPRAA